MEALTDSFISYYYSYILQATNMTSEISRPNHVRAVDLCVCVCFIDITLFLESILSSKTVPGHHHLILISTTTTFMRLEYFWNTATLISIHFYRLHT